MPPFRTGALPQFDINPERGANQVVQARPSRPCHHQPEEDQDVERFVRNNEIIELAGDRGRCPKAKVHFRRVCHLRVAGTLGRDIDKSRGQTPQLRAVEAASSPRLRRADTRRTSLHLEGQA